MGPDLLGGFGNGVVGPDGDELRGHEAPCGILVVGQQLLDILGILERGQDLFGKVQGKIGQNVRRIVRIELVDHGGEPFVRNGVHQIGSIVMIELGQYFGGRFNGQPLENLTRQILLQVGDQAGQVGRMQIGRNVHDHPLLARFDQRGDVVDQLGIQVNHAHRASGLGVLFLENGFHGAGWKDARTPLPGMGGPSIEVGKPSCKIVRESDKVVGGKLLGPTARP